MPTARLVVPAACVGLLGLITATLVVARDEPPRRPVTAAALPSPTAGSSPPSRAPEPTAASPSGVPSIAAATPAPARPSPAALPRVPRPGEPVAPADDAGLARVLRAADDAIVEPSTSPHTLARQSHLWQISVRALVTAPQRRQATYDLLEPRLRAAVRSDVTAGAALRAMIRRPKTALPPWRIVAPAPAAELLGHYRAAEREFGVGWEYLAAIHLVETRMGRIRGVSSAGAQGPMQFLPATWRAYGGGGDIHSNRDSIRAAARYLRESGAPGRMRAAVYAYNHDNRYVDAVLAYAQRMRADSRAFRNYHGWQVYYVTTAGDVWLPVGFANG